MSDHPVGVDIQQCRSFKPNIADRFFHPDEVQYLSSLSPAERENAFYTLWALKESYVKADGRGLRLPRDAAQAARISWRQRFARRKSLNKQKEPIPYGIGSFLRFMG